MFSSSRSVRKLDCSPSTLRFNLHQMESGFISSRMDVLIARTRAVAVMGSLVVLMGLLINLFLDGYLDGGSFNQFSCLGAEGFENSRTSVFLSIGLLTAFVIYSMGLCLDKFVRSHPVALEWSVVTMCILAMWVGVLSSPGYLMRLRGSSGKGDVCQVTQSDAVILMMIDGVITIVHIGVPVRWCTLLPLEVLAVVSYAFIVFVRASPESMSNGIFCLVVLIAIVISAALSKRANEVSERSAWRDIINERSLRCEAEFKLSSAALQAKPVEQDRSSGSQVACQTNASVPLTTVSGRVFGGLTENGTSLPRQQLQRIAEMGDAEHWRVKTRELKILEGEVLGSGGFGVVTKGIFCGMMVAVKRSHRRLDKFESVLELCNELRVLRHLRHPNIVATHGAVVNVAEQQIMLVLELVEGVTLTQWMARDVQRQRGSALPRLQVITGVCRALLYMHTRRPRIIHGDLKSANIMVQVLGNAVHAKILDFGLSRVVTRNPRCLGGTLAWVAPEVLKGKPPKCSADIYSFGRVIVHIATASSPEEQITPASLQRAMKQGRPPLPKWPRDCIFEPTCRPLVQSCLLVEEERRPSIAQVYRQLLNVPAQMHLVDVYGDFVYQLAFISEHFDQDIQDQPSEMSDGSGDEVGSLVRAPSREAPSQEHPAPSHHHQWMMAMMKDLDEEPHLASLPEEDPKCLEVADPRKEQADQPAEPAAASKEPRLQSLPEESSNSPDAAPLATRLPVDSSTARASKAPGPPAATSGQSSTSGLKGGARLPPIAL